MNLEITIDKKTCFYYWVQLVSGWDSYPAGLATYYNSWRNRFEPSDKQKNALNNIKNILKAAKNPRLILSELYSNSVNSTESKKIIKQSEQLEVFFENIWEETLPNLKLWSNFLKSADFTCFKYPMKKIANFLDSDFDLSSAYTLYLLQNMPLNGPVGHAIKGTDFILFCPPVRENKEIERDVISVIVHEYIHLIEFKSKTSRLLFEKSINKYIISKNIPSPNGYSWTAMYFEVLVACFANTITGGYLRPEIYSKPMPTIVEMQGGFNRIVKEKRYNTDHIINWAALNILPDVIECIEKGLKINQKIIDKVSRVFLDSFDILK